MQAEHQCSCSQPFQSPPDPSLLPLFWGLQRMEPGNWPALPWLYFHCSSSLHHPAVARLTWKASSQKSVHQRSMWCARVIFHRANKLSRSLRYSRVLE
ncbi:hypothetical protein F7725_001984, partial [Dissostichus mawsoni]